MNLVAIPCYNESKTVGSVVLFAKRYADQVIVIDDGSRDDSVEVAQMADAQVFKHYYNIGYGAATIHAFYLAKQLNADILITLDADGQHNPADIPRFIAALQNCDVVIGSRFLSTKNKAPIYRQLGQRVLSLMGSIGFGLKLTDNQCGYRAFNKRAIYALQDMKEKGMSISEELHQQMALRNLICKEIPIDVRYD